MMAFVWLLFAFASVASVPVPTPPAPALELVTLTSKNSISLRGSITDSTADEFLIGMLTRRPTYAYIDSNGGSVMAGNRIVMALEDANVTCIAHRAYSMAFVILQACKHRVVTEMASVMQHQMSLGIRGNLINMNHYLHMINKLESFLNAKQAERIGLDDDVFQQLVANDWWLFGDDIVHEKVADDVVKVTCSKELVDKNVTKTTTSFFGTERQEIYSGCPLIQRPLSGSSPEWNTWHEDHLPLVLI